MCKLDSTMYCCTAVKQKTLEAQDRKQTETAQMRFFRSVKKIRIKDKKENRVTRTELKTQTITDEIKDFKRTGNIMWREWLYRD